MSVTTTSDVPESQITYYEMRLLARLQTNLTHARWGTPYRIPRNAGKKINMRRFLPLERNTSPLVEGVTPAGKTLKAEEVEVEVKQFGDFVELSDLVQTTSVDPVVSETIDLLGDQAGGSLDEIVRDVITSGTNVRYAGGVLGRHLVGTANKITRLEMKMARRDLKRKGVLPFPGGYYACLISTDVAVDLQEDPKWEPAKLYGKPDDIEAGLIGRLDGIEYWESPNAKVWEGAGLNGVDVHATLLFGQNAYGVVSYVAPEAGGIDPQFGGEEVYKLPVKVIIKQLGSGGTTDPLDQRGTLGWKVAYAAKILQQLAMLRIESAATA